MFTGISEEVGRVAGVTSIPGGLRINIQAELITADLNQGDSINVDGTCLTAVGCSSRNLFVEAVGETLEKTTLKTFRPGRPVNLERALKSGQRFDGHIVTGHTSGLARIETIRRRGRNYYLEVSVPLPSLPYIIGEGSIALDGLSLTVAKLKDNLVGISIIPYTAATTTLKYKKRGDLMNLETDVLAKYVEKIILFKTGKKNTLHNLKTWGYV